MNTLQHLSRRQKSAIALTFERIMAAIATLNLLLVAFDLSYIQLRNFWLQGIIQVPFIGLIINVPILSEEIDSSPVTAWYDPIKGIQPHRETQHYLQVINQLEQQVKQTGYGSTEAKIILAELQDLSEQMIAENPFQGANKSGTLEKIKNRVRDHMGKESAKEAFKQFWTADHLLKDTQEFELFKTKVAPLIATNYYRSIDETGGPTDLFAALDFPFALLFLGEFLVRSFYISSKHDTITLRDAMLWRWYDVFLFLPILRWLRILPVTIRLHQAKIINLEPVRAQFSRGFVASFAGELTEVIMIRVINQIQEEVRSGSIVKQLIEGSARQYIDINDINEIEAITNRLTQVIICQVFPTLQPELKEIIHHNLNQIIQTLPFYHNLPNLPGLKELPDRLTEELSQQWATLITQGSQSLYESIKNDTTGAQLINQLAEKFGKSLGAELQQKHTTQELQSLLSDFLEEFKLNYVQRLAQEDIEKILEETKRLGKVSKA